MYGGKLEAVAQQILIKKRRSDDLDASLNTYLTYENREVQETQEKDEKSSPTCIKYFVRVDDYNRSEAARFLFSLLKQIKD